MGIFSKLFGTAKGTKEIVDAVITGGDKLFFTSEERADADGELRSWFIDYLKATEPQTLSRRFIAMGVTLLWIALIALAVAVWPFSESYASYVVNILTDIVAVPFAGIMAFYFMTSLSRSFRKPKE